MRAPPRRRARRPRPRARPRDCPSRAPTSPGPTSSSAQLAPASASVTAAHRAAARPRPRPRADRSPRPPRSRGDAARRGRVPTRACSSRLSGPSSRMSPSTATCRPGTSSAARASSAATHRDGRGVVRVVEHADAPGGVDQLHPPGRADRGRQRGDHRREGNPEVQRDRRGLRGVHDLVGSPRTPSPTSPVPQGVSSRNRGCSAPSSVDVGDRGRRAAGSVPTVSTGAALRWRCPAVRSQLARDDRETVGRERVEQLALHPRDAFGPAEVLGVGDPDVGDDPDLGEGDRAEVGDVPGEAGTHLHDEHLGVLRRPEHGDRARRSRC